MVAAISLIDDHTTDGADYRHDVTYGYNVGVGVPAALSRWIDEHYRASSCRGSPRCRPGSSSARMAARLVAFTDGQDPPGCEIVRIRSKTLFARPIPLPGMPVWLGSNFGG